MACAKLVLLDMFMSLIGCAVALFLRERARSISLISMRVRAPLLKMPEANWLCLGGFCVVFEEDQRRQSHDTNCEDLKVDYEHQRGKSITVQVARNIVALLGQFSRWHGLFVGWRATWVAMFAVSEAGGQGESKCSRLWGVRNHQGNFFDDFNCADGCVSCCVR